MRTAPRPPSPPPSTSCRYRHALEPSGTFASFTDERAVHPTLSSRHLQSSPPRCRDLVSSKYRTPSSWGPGMDGMGCPRGPWCVSVGDCSRRTRWPDRGGQAGGRNGMPKRADECLEHVVSPARVLKRKWREASQLEKAHFVVWTAKR